MFSKSSIDFKNLHPINHSALIPLSRKFVSLPARFKGLVTTGDTFVWYGDKESDPVEIPSGSVGTFAENEAALTKALERLEVKEEREGETRAATFSATNVRFVPLVIQKLKDLGFKEITTGGEVFQIYSSKLDNPKLEGPKEGVAPLRAEDADEIAKYWKYARNHHRAVSYIQHIMKILPSGGVRGENGELEAWALTHTDGPIGIVHTKDQFRNKGHARRIVAYLSKELMKLDKNPHAVVEVDNEPSIALFTSLGFESDGAQISWIHAH